MLGNSFKLTDEGWLLLNKRWMFFFFSLAILNEIVWRTQCPENEHIWVNFKVWGMLPITFIFTAFQINIINKYKINE
jgi:intracellular septation protein